MMSVCLCINKQHMDHVQARGHTCFNNHRQICLFYFKAWTCCPTEKTVYFKFTEINKQINTSH